jgi:hypothetical protein
MLYACKKYFIKREGRKTVPLTERALLCCRSTGRIQRNRDNYQK